MAQSSSDLDTLQMGTHNHVTTYYHDLHKYITLKNWIWKNFPKISPISKEQEYFVLNPLRRELLNFIFCRQKIIQILDYSYVTL